MFLLILPVEVHAFGHVSIEYECGIVDHRVEGSFFRVLRGQRGSLLSTVSGEVGESKPPRVDGSSADGRSDLGRLTESDTEKHEDYGFGVGRRSTSEEPDPMHGGTHVSFSCVEQRWSGWSSRW